MTSQINQITVAGTSVGAGSSTTLHLNDAFKAMMRRAFNRRYHGRHRRHSWLRRSAA